MIISCPKCRKNKEIGSESRYHVFTCDKCDHRFLGVHANVSTLRNFIKFWISFDDSVGRMNRTACPHCFGLIPVITDRNGLNCMYCGGFVDTTPVEQILRH